MTHADKILIIDDDEKLCVLIKRNLEKRGGVDVAYALTGEEGMRLVGSLKPDMIFLDLMLPDAGGIELIKRISQIDNKIKIVVLSGMGTHEYVRMAFESGAADFATKPCSFSTLLKLIKKHLHAHPRPLQAPGDIPKRRVFTKTVLLGILAGFVFISEAKNKYLRGHTKRVAKLSKELGQRMGLDENHLEIVEYSAMLHDLGKIGVKDSILNKEGPLTEREWKDIKKHPQIGYRIISKVQLFRLEEPNIKYHHERFDGKGYPEGLKADQIPLGARIISLADAYDAMTSQRSYRGAMNKDQAMSEIKKNSGIQFDPTVVDAFMQTIGSSQ